MGIYSRVWGGGVGWGLYMERGEGGGGGGGGGGGCEGGGGGGGGGELYSGGKTLQFAIC